MLVTVLPFLVCVIGLLVYALAVNSKVSEIGRIAFFVGLFFVVWVFSRVSFRLG
jgi:Na+/phosphate symporter